MHYKPAYEPTPEEIDQMTAAIRATWSETDFRRRSHGLHGVDGRASRLPRMAEMEAEAYCWTPPEVQVGK